MHIDLYVERREKDIYVNDTITVINIRKVVARIFFRSFLKIETKTLDSRLEEITAV